MIAKKVYYILVPIVLLIIWQMIIILGLVSPLFLASPHDVWISFIESLLDGTMLVDISFTLYRVISSFLIAAAIGVPLGLLMGYSKKVYTVLEFTVEFFRGIPTTALFPLFLLIFGIGDQAKIAIAAWGAGLIILINSMYGVHLGKELRVKVAKTMKVKGLTMFEKVILPEALPHIFSGFKVAISISLVIVIVTEMFIGTSTGLGKRIIDAQLVYQTPTMYAAIITTGVIGYSLNKLMMFIESRMVHWKGK
ncbi:MAG: ABC transporter permease [Candidatus Berkelbacteria bacterium]|nr:ABC transporter permease [Candidatus Berkelbacteria bacterium]